MTKDQFIELCAFIRHGLIGAAQVLIWWSLCIATAGVAVALWLLITPAVRSYL